MRDCVRYLAKHPGASNSQIGEGIDLRHQGQLSKLLEGLRQAELVIKKAGRAGHPNAWTLSTLGAQAVMALEQAGQTLALTPPDRTVEGTA